jgi:DNA-binding CsgD family transcriptional regulator/tetratricopeptide (TPR) repeat protein/KaiC/GvpD/RAD55 family RecA-like ATPase
MSQQTVPFIGRDDLLEQLDLALTHAGSGHGSVVLIYGEAGIGKTRLCDQVGRAHRDHGGRVLLGRATPEESAIAFAPLADALRASRRTDPPLWEAVSARSDLLSMIVPELSSGMAGYQYRPVDHPVLFEALLDAVEESARGDKATFLILDDVHWADDATWHFIRYAARRVADMNLVLTITYRDEEIGPANPHWTGLVRLRREPHVLTLPMPRLNSDDARRLVEALVPLLPPDVMIQILARSAGTPLLIEELARIAEHSADLPAIPDIVRATVRERTSRLAFAERDLLDVAAAAGLAVEAWTLQSVRPGSSADALVAAGLLTQDGENYRFRHPLLWEAVDAEVPPDRKRVLHEELARSLSSGAHYSAERVAHHLQRAGQPNQAISVLEQAAEAAHEAGDLGRAGTLYLAAFRLARSDQGLSPQSNALENKAISHLYLARRWTELNPLIHDAWSRRDRLSDHERAWLAMPLAWLLYAQGRIAASWQLIDEELTHSGGSIPSLSSQAAYIAWQRGDPELALKHVERGLDAARQQRNELAVWWAQHHRVHIEYRLNGDRRAAIAAFRDRVAAARELGIPDGEALAFWDLACHTASREDVAAGLVAADHAGATSTLLDLRMLDGMLLLLEGDAEEAESLFVRFGTRIRAGEPASAPWIDLYQAFVHLHRGEIEAARDVLHGPASTSEAARTEYHIADRSLALGWLAWEDGRWAEAVDHLEQSLQLWRTGCWHTVAGGPLLLPLHVDALLRLRRPDAAARLLERAPAKNDARFYAASLAAARFRHEPNNHLAEVAHASAAAAPWPWLSALLATWRGELLGDSDSAMSAAALCEEIEAASGVVRAERVLRRLGVQRPGSAGPRGPLSERELEVAQLIAEGLSNPAIAARLYLSRPTVASHVTHILTKLGFSSRSQIAAWISRQSFI